MAEGVVAAAAAQPLTPFGPLMDCESLSCGPWWGSRSRRQ